MWVGKYNYISLQGEDSSAGTNVGNKTKQVGENYAH